MKNVMLMVVMALAIAGCKDRVIWNDNGAVEAATQDRKVWDSEGKMEGGERKIWKKSNGEPVVE